MTVQIFGPNFIAYTEQEASKVFQSIRVVGFEIRQPRPGFNIRVYDVIDRITIELLDFTNTMELFVSSPAVVNANSISVSYDNLTGILTLERTGRAISDQIWNQVLDAVVYYNASDQPTSPNLITVTAYNDDTSESASLDIDDIRIMQVNDPPVFTTFDDNPVDTTGVNKQVEITFSELAAQGDQSDVDGVVTAFQVINVNEGTLFIGSSPDAAIPWELGLNDTVDATTNLYWTPPLGKGGTSIHPLAINAFVVYAIDDSGARSRSRVAATVNVTCLLAGTLVATPSGNRLIECLQPGDLVSSSEGPQPVRFISRTSHFPVVLDNADELPIRISAGAFGELGPVRDLYVSPGHAILLDGHLLHASVLVNGTSITRTTLDHWRHLDQPIEYLNIELERHHLISAEGLTVESYVDMLPRCDWDNYTAYLTLYGEEQPIQELPLPRVLFRRQLSFALRQRLDQLAGGGSKKPDAGSISTQPCLSSTAAHGR